MYDVKLIEKQAKEIRRLIVKMIGRAQSGHPGGSLSCADLVSALYFGVMNVDPKDPAKPDRDRFVMSKGHACPALYAALALKGYFPMEELDTLRDLVPSFRGTPPHSRLPALMFRQVPSVRDSPSQTALLLEQSWTETTTTYIASWATEK